MNNFTQLHELVISDLSVKDLGKLNLPELTRLRISRSQMIAFEQGTYPKLHAFYINDTPLQTFTIRNQPNLREMALQNCELEVLTLENLPILRQLILQNNPIEEIDSLPQSLRILDMSDNRLARLGPLPAGLVTLDVSHNQFRELPQLPSSLELLDASINQLRSLPSLSHINALRTLNLNGNSIEVLPFLPDSIEQLDVGNNQLREISNLPASAFSINLINNKLSTLPELPVLRGELNLAINEFEEMPDFGPEQNLSSLSMAHNRLRRIGSMDFFRRTVSLHFAHNQITKIEGKWNYLIESVDLRNNLLETIDATKPFRLNHVFLGNNPLKPEGNTLSWLNIPDLNLHGGITAYPDFSQLNQIGRLVITDAGLTSLTGSPKNARYINLDNNSLRELPNLKELSPSLRVLSVKNNQLEALPEMPSPLRELWVPNNRITDIQTLLDFIDHEGEIRHLEVDLRENLLDSNSCLMLALFNPHWAPFVEPQAHGESLDCGWIEEPIFMEGDPFVELLAQGAELYRASHPIDFADFADLTPLNLARVERLDLSGYTGEIDQVDLSPVAQLVGLRAINVADFALENADVLAVSRLLEEVDISNGQLETFPLLPDSVVHLSVSSNAISEIPVLPPRLRSFRANHTRITLLPPLPASLQHLEAVAARLTALPKLPDRLESLLVSANPIGELPELPPNLLHLYCHSLGLIELPELPEKLLILYAQYNKLAALPPLPQNLKTLVLSHNQLIEVPPITVANEVYLDHNALTAAPELLSRRNQVKLNHNPIEDWQAVADWSSLKSLDVQATGLDDLDVFLQNLDLFSLNAGEFNVSNNLLETEDCDALNQVVRQFNVSLIYESQQLGNLDCVDLGEIVAFRDPILEAYLLQYVISYEDDLLLDRNRDGVIHVIEAERVRHLFLWDGRFQFSDATGIEAFAGLEQLTIQNQQNLEVLPDVSGLEKLEHYTLARVNGQVVDGLPLNLEHFGIYDSGASSIVALPAGLKRFAVQKTLLSSVPPLPSGLQEITLWECGLTALPTIPASVNYLDASGNQISELPVFEGEKIEQLFMGWNQLTDISALEALSGYRELDLSHNQLTEIPNFQASPTFSYAGFQNNLISDLEGSIEGLTGLMNASHFGEVDISQNLLDQSACEVLQPLLLNPSHRNRIYYREQQNDVVLDCEGEMN
jgi:Leucine-rich repeat (LRR) protein